MLLNAVAEHDVCPVHRDQVVVEAGRDLVEALITDLEKSLMIGGLSGLEKSTKKQVRASAEAAVVAGVNDALGELLIDERIGVRK